MGERKKESFAPPALGGSSLLVVFAVLALTVFALLSLSTVRADVRLGDAAAKAVSGYYAADAQAQEILARLRNGEQPMGVTFSGSGLLCAEYAVPISDTRELQVEVILRGVTDRDYVVKRWEVVPVGVWEPDQGLDVWDGEIIF